MQLATLCYVKNDGHTLMLHRIVKENDIHAGKWNGLGGKFDSGETPEECIVREVHEESGLTITRPELRGLLTFPKFDGEEDWYVYVFTATDFRGTLIDSPEGRLEWINDAKVYDLNIWEGDRIFLKWLDDDRFFSGKFEYEHGILKHHQVVFYK